MCLLVSPSGYAAGKKATTRPTKTGIQKLFPIFNKKIDAFFKKKKFAGLSVGFVVNQKLVYTRHLGHADLTSQRKPNDHTLYRIGSITKVFTTTMLAQMRDKGLLRLDDPIHKYAPKGTRFPTAPRGAKAITFRHLATHTSGLPRLPVNLKSKKGAPYNNYSAKALYKGLGFTLLNFPIGHTYMYSNLGMGLLGELLARQAKMGYEKALKKMLLQPLTLNETSITLSPKLKKQLAVGYHRRGCYRSVPAWKLGVLNPAGGLVSSVHDMARFLAFQHRAGQRGVKVLSGGTLREMHTVQRLLGNYRRGYWKGGIGLGWHILPIRKTKARVVFHNGGVAGFRSFAGFIPSLKMGIIVFVNCGKSGDKLGFSLLKTLAKKFWKKPTPTPTSRVIQIAHALRKQIKANPDGKAIKALFEPFFLRMIPLFKIRFLLGKLYFAHGPCNNWQLKPAKLSRGIWLHCKTKNNRTLRGIIVLKATTKGRIAMLRFFPVKKKKSKKKK